jgi:hypothetical protein
VLVVLLASAVVFYQVSPSFPTSARAPEASPVPTSPAPASATPHSPASATPSPRTPEKPDQPPPDGPGTTEPGVYLSATAAADGTFDVAEILLLPTPISRLTLQPPQAARLGPLFRRSVPAASQVQVGADGQPVVVPSTLVATSTTIDLGLPSRRIELRYRLRGVTVRSTPSKPGRALAGLAPLTAGYSTKLPVAISVSGYSVRNLQCPSLRLNLQACSTGSPPRLRVARSLPRKDAMIIIQLDLARPQ